MRNAKHWMLLLVLLLLTAGCLGGKSQGDGGDPPEPSTSSQSSSGTNAPAQCPSGESPPCSGPELNGTQVRRLELLDCQTFWMFYPADGQKLQALMPPGYSFAQGTLPTAGLDAFVCQSVVIDNLTVVHDFRWYAASGLARVPDEARSPDGTNGYHWETCMNLPEVQDVFRSAGFKVCNGTIAAEITMGNVLGLKFYQSGVLTYDYQGGGQGGNGTVHFPESIRTHHYNGHNTTWLDQKTDNYNPSIGEAGTLMVHGGLISQVMLNPGEATVAHSGIGRGRFSIEFPPVATQR
jgi:hypothetical protein